MRHAICAATVLRSLPSSRYVDADGTQAHAARSAASTAASVVLGVLAAYAASEGQIKQ